MRLFIAEKPAVANDIVKALVAILLDMMAGSKVITQLWLMFWSYYRITATGKL